MNRLRWITRLSLLVLAVAAAQPAFAQRAKEKESGKEVVADYSREALLEIFAEPSDIVPPKNPFDTGIIFERGPVRYRFMPIVAPFIMSALGSMDTTPMPTVDPFALTGMSMPYDSGSWENRYENWRIRRMMRKNIEAANRKDNNPR